MSAKTSTTTTTPEGETKGAGTPQDRTVDPHQPDTGIATEQQEPIEDQDEAKGGGNKEAAKYRRQLRDAQAERDGLAETVETLRRHVIATAMPTDRIKPDALWATGHNAAEFFDESGQLDGAKLSTITTETAATLGVPLQDVIRESGMGQGSGSVEPKATWSDALKRRA